MRFLDENISVIVLRESILSRFRNNQILDATLQFQRKAYSRVRKEWARKGRCAIVVRECPDCAREEEPNGIHYSVCTHYATRMTGARVLTRIRPRVFAPYDASTRSVVKPWYTLERRRIHPVSNYYDKLHAGDALTSTPANFAELIWQSRFMLFINFNFTYTPISIATRSHRTALTVVFL